MKKTLPKILATVLLCSPVASQADVNSISKKLAGYESELNELRSGIRAPNSIGQARTNDLITQRILDAEVNFGIGNYDDAAVVLYDITEKHQSHPGWPEAVYYLGESLFQKGNLIGSRSAFALLVEKEGARTKYYQQSLQRLIELTLKLDDGTGADKWLDALDQVPTAEKRNTVPYVRGKYAFFKKDYDRALALFRDVPKSSDYFPQAKYFMAASYVGQRELPKASALLKRLVDYPVSTDEHRRVIELSHMALGRIYYEQDQPSQAVNSYLNISRTSKLFDESLYEIAWVHVKNKNNGQAIEALELLDLADPNSAQAPEVKILEGNLRIRQGQQLAEDGKGSSQEQYDKAVKLFDYLRATYAEPKKTIEAIRDENRDPRAYMAQITGRESKTFDTRATLPPVAAGWLRQEPGVSRVVAVEADLEEIQRQVNEAEITIERLEKTLGSQSRVNSFPSLAEKRARSTEILEDVVRLRMEFNDIRRAKVATRATPEQKSQLDQLLKDRLRILTELGALPNSDVTFRQRVQQEKARYVSIDQTAAQAATTTANASAEMRALEHFLADASVSKLPEKDAELFNVTMAELKTEVVDLQAELEKAQRDLRLAQDLAGVGDPNAAEIRSKRAQLAALLDQENTVLSAVGDDPQLASLDKRSSDLTSDLESLNQRVDKTVDEALSGVRSTLSEEKTKLATYNREFLNYEKESRELGGTIIAQSFDNVARKFYDILIRSDAGTIDVTWSVRESADQLARRLTLDQARERKTLDAEFADVIKQIRNEGAN